MRLRTLALLAWLSALAPAVGCAVRSAAVAPEPSRYPPPAGGIPATLGPPADAVRPAAGEAVGVPTAADRPVAFAPRPNLRVYVVDGADPLGIGGARGLADRLRADGFAGARHVRWVRARGVEREIRAAHAADPSARFALVGYSAGTFAVRMTANRLIRDGVPVAVVGYVGGDYLSDTAATRVAGAGRVVNVTGDGHLLTGGNLLFNGADISGARNLRLAGTGHYSLLQHPDTVAALEAELHAAAGE